MKLQKLVFLAHGITLALLNEPLTYHNVHAWQWGPVFPQLYKRFSAYGSSLVENPAACEDAVIEESEENEVISSIWNHFGQLSGPQLSALTHEPGSPWDVTWRMDQYSIIPNDLIRDFYQKQFDVKAQAD